MKKTIFVWIMLVLGFINFSLLLSGMFLSEMTSFDIVISVIGLLLSIIFVYKLFKGNNKLLFWTNLFIGFMVITQIYSAIAVYNNDGGTNPTMVIVSNAVVLIIEIVIWILFYKHLKKQLLTS